MKKVVSSALHDQQNTTNGKAPQPRRRNRQRAGCRRRRCSVRYLEELRIATETLAKLPPKNAIDYLYGAAMESGGYLTIPTPDDTSDAQIYEVRAYSVYARGERQAELQHNWQRAAACEIATLEALFKAEAIVLGPLMETRPETLEEAAALVVNLSAAHPEARQRAQAILDDKTTQVA